MKPNSKKGESKNMALFEPNHGQAILRILQTTDLHLNLLPYDYFTDKPAPFTGLAQAASLVRQLRSDMRNCLLFDNGDFLQGNPLADWIARQHGQNDDLIHPMIAAMNSLNYDAATIGNHEFDYGLPFLLSTLSGATFPVVSANTFRSGHGSDEADPDLQNLLTPYVLLDRTITKTDGQVVPICVGVVGFAPPQLVQWNKLVLKGEIKTENIVTAAHRLVPLMRAAGADIIIALSHSGISDSTAADDTENAAVGLATVPGISVVLAGHTHRVFPGPGTPASQAIDPDRGTLHGKPAVMAGHHGTHVGVIDLLLEHIDGAWKILDHHACARPVAVGPDEKRPSLGLDPEIQSIAANGHTAILAHIRRPIGHSAAPLHSFFAQVAASRSMQVVADAQRARAQSLLSHTEYAHLPVLSAVAPGMTGGLAGSLNYVDISPGPLALRHAAELYVYPNTFCIIRVTGNDLLNWLERVTAQFSQIVPGQCDQPLLDDKFPSYNFDVIDGLTYEIDPSQVCRFDASGRLVNPLGSRIRQLHWQGKPVGPDQYFAVATNSYRVGGGGNFEIIPEHNIIHYAAENARDVVVNYLSAANVTDTPVRPIWRFTSLPQTSAWFESGSGGLQYLSEISDRQIKDIGPVPNGFHRYQLTF